TYKGISLESQGKHDEAITYFDKVLALDPNNENTLNWKEHTLRKIGKYDNTVTNIPEQADFTDTNNTEFNDAKNKAKDLLTSIFNTIFSETGEKFSNSKYGVDMAFPKNWTGIEMKVVPMALVSPEGFNFTEMFSTISNATVDTVTESIVSDGVNELSEQKKQELAESVSNKLTQKFENMTSTMGILIHDKEFARFVNSFNPNSTIPEDSLTSIFERLMLASDPTTVCDRKTLERITINDNISAEKSTQQCLLTDSNLKRDNLNYFILTPNAIVGIIFSSDSNNQNEKYLREFEESLKSLSINESLPINNQSIHHFLNDDMNNNTDTLLNDTAQNILNA
ncbi:MAG TPA: tetratricopeptide repeat protein, partial [Nitrososphaeraceae archaeon]